MKHQPPVVGVQLSNQRAWGWHPAGRKPKLHFLLHTGSEPAVHFDVTLWMISAMSEKKETIYSKLFTVHTEIQFHDKASSLNIPPLFYFGDQSSVLCSSSPPRASHFSLGNSEWAAEELCLVQVLHEIEDSIHLENSKTHNSYQAHVW